MKYNLNQITPSTAFKDGDEITIEGAWVLSLAKTREEVLQGFLEYRDRSASLAAARGTGCVSDSNWNDLKIPERVCELLDDPRLDRFE